MGSLKNSPQMHKGHKGTEGRDFYCFHQYKYQQITKSSLRFELRVLCVFVVKKQFFKLPIFISALKPYHVRSTRKSYDKTIRTASNGHTCMLNSPGLNNGMTAAISAGTMTKEAGNAFFFITATEVSCRAMRMIALRRRKVSSNEVNGRSNEKNKYARKDSRHGIPDEIPRIK